MGQGTEVQKQRNTETQAELTGSAALAAGSTCLISGATSLIALLIKI